MKPLLLLLFTFLNFGAFAQKTSNVENGKDEIFVNPEQMPEFPGSINEFIVKHQGHPVDEQGKKLTGRVVVRFYILKTGKISDIVIVRKVHPKLDADAISIIKKMPKWKPGRIEDKPIKMPMALPIVYK